MTHLWEHSCKVCTTLLRETLVGRSWHTVVTLCMTLLWEHSHKTLLWDLLYPQNSRISPSNNAFLQSLRVFNITEFEALTSSEFALRPHAHTHTFLRGLLGGFAFMCTHANMNLKVKQGNERLFHDGTCVNKPMNGIRTCCMYHMPVNHSKLIIVNHHWVKEIAALKLQGASFVAGRR